MDGRAANVRSASSWGFPDWCTLKASWQFPSSRPSFASGLANAFKREVRALKHLKGVASPCYRRHGTHEERPYVIMDWCRGTNVLTAAKQQHTRTLLEQRRENASLCVAILDAYSDIHKRGVIHGDVHPGNIFVLSDGRVVVIDFGLSRLVSANSRERSRRGGIAYFLDPEYAAARRKRDSLPSPDFSTEQYSLATVVYLLLAGKHYLDFAADRENLLRQIIEDPPLAFSSQQLEPWPEVETVLRQALEKPAEKRFASVEDFATAFKNAAAQHRPRSTGQSVYRPPVGKELLKKVVNRLNPAGDLFRTGIEQAPTCSLNYGSSGIAYALYRIACVQNDPRLLSFADAWCSKATMEAAIDNEGGGAAANHDELNLVPSFHNRELGLTPSVVGPVSIYHTESGIHLVRALIGLAMGDLVTVAQSLDSFVGSCRRPTEQLDLTLGLTSTLIGASLILESVPKENELLETKSLLEFGTETLEKVWNQLNAKPAMQECKDIPFLGIAHGWAGLLYATLRWCQASGDEAPSQLVDRLDELAALKEPAGRGLRWPRRFYAGRPRPNDFMAGWCNGSAGFVYLWTLASEIIDTSDYLELAEGAAWHAWEDDNRYASLCCGLAGRAYALVNFSKHGNEKHSVWMDRVIRLMERAINDDSVQGLENSLYKGEIGVALLASCLTRPEMAAMPAFESEAIL